MDEPEAPVGADAEPNGGESPCFADQVCDHCGVVGDEPHREGCPQARRTMELDLFAGVAVSDLPRAIAWFDRFFGDVENPDGNELGGGGPPVSR